MQVPNTEDNQVRCICPNCPTYNKCMEEEEKQLFCSQGKTVCDFNRQGCICGECPISSDYRLSQTYYCDIGAA